jgi:GNAT superfamily N-acetyltransferase
MSLTTQVERYTKCEPELIAIYDRHWRELNVAPDIPLEPQYSTYQQLDAADAVILTTLRDDGRLVGYFMGFIFPELHYKSVLACFGDIFYILPEYRSGWNGIKLFRFTETVLGERGVTRWHVTSKLHKDSGALLKRLGFAAIETHYSKRLK